MDNDLKDRIYKLAKLGYPTDYEPAQEDIDRLSMALEAGMTGSGVKKLKTPNLDQTQKVISNPNILKAIQDKIQGADELERFLGTAETYGGKIPVKPTESIGPLKSVENLAKESAPQGPAPIPGKDFLTPEDTKKAAIFEKLRQLISGK